MEEEEESRKCIDGVKGPYLTKVGNSINHQNDSLRTKSIPRIFC